MNTTQAPTRAQQIRAALKSAFPGVKFSVRKDTGTAALWVQVSWTDGPTVDTVEQVTAPFNLSGDYGCTTLNRYYSPEAEAFAAERVAAEPWRWANSYDFEGETYYAERRCLAEADLRAVAA